MKGITRSFAWLLALALMLSFAPPSAMAEEGFLQGEPLKISMYAVKKPLSAARPQRFRRPAPRRRLIVRAIATRSPRAKPTAVPTSAMSRVLSAPVRKSGQYFWAKKTTQPKKVSGKLTPFRRGFPPNKILRRPGGVPPGTRHRLLAQRLARQGFFHQGEALLLRDLL